MKRRILIADSDPAAQKQLSSIISAQGLEVLSAANASQGYAQLSSACPDVMLLNIKDTKAADVLRAAREWSDIPIIALGETLTEAEKISALDSGADLVLEKPLSSAEVIAYIKVFLRHLSRLEEWRGMKSGKYVCGELCVDMDCGTVSVNKKIVHLTVNEFKILCLLCRYSGRVLSYDFIMNSVWGPMGRSNRGLLRVNVTNIRRKIEPDPQSPIYLITENGIGYRITAQGS